jgi:hypothetical protein
MTGTSNRCFSSRARNDSHPAARTFSVAVAFIMIIIISLVVVGVSGWIDGDRGSGGGGGGGEHGDATNDRRSHSHIDVGDDYDDDDHHNNWRQDCSRFG